MTIPSDLLIGLIAILAISATAFICCSRIRSRRRSSCVAILAALILVLYAVLLNDNPLLTHILPVANVLLWGNLQLPAAALLGGVAWSNLHGPMLQRIVLVVSLIGIGVWRQAGPLLGRPPELGPSYWAHGVCRQTSKSSCSAAAAATLLAKHGIDVTESEMVDACLTHVEGTTNLGIYRGLMLETRGTPWIVRCTNSKADIHNWPFPAMVNITVFGLHKDLMHPATGKHTVVVLGLLPGGRIDVGDPYVGRESWRLDEMRDVCDGELFTLIPR